MGPSIRSCSIVVFVCLLLTGCKINVSVLGEGQISVLTPDIASCASAPGDLCLNAGYNQAVELRAIPARGYVFVGWSGACSGVATCTLHSLGDRHVVAVFRTEDTFGFPMIPAMRNLDDFFFSGPGPAICGGAIMAPWISRIIRSATACWPNPPAQKPVDRLGLPAMAVCIFRY